MRHFNARNERIKKEYLDWLREADRKSPGTIDGVRKAILRFETYTGLQDFASFNKEQAKAFKRHLASSRTVRTGEPLAKATILSTVRALKAFLKWLASQPGYKGRIKVTDIEYLNLGVRHVSRATGRFRLSSRFARFSCRCRLTLRSRAAIGP